MQDDLVSVFKDFEP